MQLDSILTPGRTLQGVPGSSKKRVLEQIAQLIAEDLGYLNADEVFSHLIARERLGSTGMGNGIAIPHCRIKQCRGVIGSLITLKNPIAFEAIDDQPVDIIFVLLVPEQATQAHLDTLAALAERFTQPQYCENLRDAQSNRALYEAAISA